MSCNSTKKKKTEQRQDPRISSFSYPQTGPKKKTWRCLREAFWVKSNPTAPARKSAHWTPWSTSQATWRPSASCVCAGHIEFLGSLGFLEFLDPGLELTAGRKTSLDFNLYYGSCKQSELTACQALSHEKWMMIMMVKSTVFRRGQPRFSGSHWPKGPSLRREAPGFLLLEREKLDFVSTPKVRVSQVWLKSRSQFSVLLVHREKRIESIWWYFVDNV